MKNLITIAYDSKFTSVRRVFLKRTRFSRLFVILKYVFRKVIMMEG
jgi:hypothetical protein